MKLPGILIGIALSASCFAQQGTGDRVVVPARNSTRPRMVNVSLLQGSIVVKSYNGKEVIVETQASESQGRHRDREGPETSDGLRRLNFPGRSGLEVEEDDNVINIHTHPAGNVSVTVSVPVDTSLKLHSLNGTITVEGVHGEIEADDQNGAITLTNVSGTVVAHSLNGAMKVTMTRVDAGKPLSFSTLNGGIDVTLPADFKANVKLKTDHGEAYSDFDIKMDLSHPQAVTENNNSTDGKFRVRMDRTMYGTINGGGADATFQTFNGRIAIRKGK